MSGWDLTFLLAIGLLVAAVAVLNLIVVKANEVTMKELRRIWDEIQEKK